MGRCFGGVCTTSAALAAATAANSATMTSGPRPIGEGILHFNIKPSDDFTKEDFPDNRPAPIREDRGGFQGQTGEDPRK